MYHSFWMNRIARITIMVGIVSLFPYCERKKAALAPSDIARSRIMAVSRLSSPLSASMLTVTFRELHRQIILFGANFRPDSALVVPHSTTVPTGTSGEIEVSFFIADSTGEMAASGVVTLPLEEDWEWHVTFTNSERDPTRFCWGCRGRQAFALSPSIARSDADSLWVVWGGNFISHPVYY